MVTLKVVLAGFLMILAACGEDDGEGGNPDIFLGFSGLIIAIIVVWLIIRAFNKRG